ncbi:MAG: DUF58 domain-containing protein [Porticoccaceae bacterium]
MDNNAHLPTPPPEVVPSVESLVALRHAARDFVFFPRLKPNSSLAGPHHTRFRGRGMDFDEVRPYQPGDDMRSIDWRVTARTNTTHTKLFREERERPVYLLTDLRQTMFFGSQRMKSVTACEISAALAWAGLNSGDRVGGLVFGNSQFNDIRARRSHHAALALIRVLNETSTNLCEAQADTFTLHDMLQDLRRIAHPGAALMIISDFHDLSADPRNERHLFEMARRCDITLFHVYDPLEAALPPPGNYPLRGPLGRRSLDTRNTAQRQAFEEAFDARCEYLKQLATKLQMGYLTFSTNTGGSSDVVSTLNQHYGKARSRKARRSSQSKPHIQAAEA